MQALSRFGFLALLAVPAQAIAGDLDLGERVYRDECVNCHGDLAQGGKGGEYPRLAGQRADYLLLQLNNFRDRTRRNKPMLPVFETGKLKEPDLEAVAAYLSSLPLPPPTEVGVPAGVEGDLELGLELYERDCLLCHGADGQGKDEKGYPQIIAQYPSYLAKQMADFSNRERWHEYGDKLFGEAYPEELDALLALILSLNQEPIDPS